MQYSFEFFPPDSLDKENKLWEAVKILENLNPNFVSVTYGAGGSTRSRTHKIINKILVETNLAPAAHLTCIGASAKEINDIALNYWKMGVKHIVALRGDLPNGYEHPDDGYDYAWQLVVALKKIADFEISVAGYPEKHPQAKTIEDDLDNLKRKIDSGATRVITQFFYDNNKFYEFLNLIEKKSIKAEIVPGILPINNFNQVVRFAKDCNSSIPDNYFTLFDEIEPGNQEKQLLLSKQLVISQCKDLFANGVKNFHFYSLNRSELILAICKEFAI